MTLGEWPKETKDPKKSEQGKEVPKFKVETIQGPKNNEVSFSPERGGIIKSMKLNGIEVLYMDEKTFVDENKNVRGGIPILFPNAGPLVGENNPYPNLKQHGFARTSPNWNIEKTEGGKFSEKLLSDEETKKVFPYDLETSMKGELNEDGSITLVQEVINLEKDKGIPDSMGLHPYFKVPKEKKGDIKFDFFGGEIIEKDFNNWSQGGTTSIDNPKLNDPNAVLRVEIPELGTLVMDVSVEYQKIWIWSLPGQDFVCIEPVMRDEGGLVDEPEIVKPGEALSGKVTFRLE
jgi:galactose mutarotase-like enzyme